MAMQAVDIAENIYKLLGWRYFQNCRLIAHLFFTILNSPRIEIEIL